MFRNRNSFVFVVLCALWLMLSQTTVVDAQELKKLNGPVVALFDSPDGRLPPRQSGIFRGEDSPSAVQFIEEMPWEFTPAGSKRALGFRLYPYSLTAPETYNGAWINAGLANWTKFKDGELVLLLRRLDPALDKYTRSVDIGKPNSEAASNFKVELKVMNQQNKVSVIGLRAHVNKEHEARQQTRGFFELRLPLSDFGLNLERVHEVVIVFEKKQLLMSQHHGALGLRGVVLTTKKAENIDELIDGTGAILDDLAQKVHVWTQNVRHPVSGLTLDRAPNKPNIQVDPDKPAMVSLAATGFQLSLLPEDVRTGRLTREKASAQAEQTLRFVLDKVEHRDGMLYHFVDTRGKRWEKSEVSTLDTAIFLNGCMCVSVAFGGNITTLSDTLLDRADWTKYRMPTGKLLSLGWSPERGLLGAIDIHSSESLMPCLLAVASRTHAVDPGCWTGTAVKKGPVGDETILNPTHPLFTSQYGLLWCDLRAWIAPDGAEDLEANARATARANRAACRRFARDWPTYALAEGGFHGISAGDSPIGYIAPGPQPGDAHGVVWPMTGLASVQWIPDEIREDLLLWRASKNWDRISGPFGLSPFRRAEGKDWIAPDLITIDLGAFGMALANQRANTCRDLWMRHPLARVALERLGYRPRE